MASLRRVRRDFRKEVSRLISAGDGNIGTLVASAGKHFGYDVGYEALIRSFLHNEVSNAVSQLRRDGLIETIGKQWKPCGQLNDEDIDIISIRRLKRLRGELKAEIKLDHEHGRVEQAAKASVLLQQVESFLPAEALAQEHELEMA